MIAYCHSEKERGMPTEIRSLCKIRIETEFRVVLISPIEEIKYFLSINEL